MKIELETSDIERIVEKVVEMNKKSPINNDISQLPMRHHSLSVTMVCIYFYDKIEFCKAKNRCARGYTYLRRRVPRPSVTLHT